MLGNTATTTPARYRRLLGTVANKEASSLVRQALKLAVVSTRKKRAAECLQRCIRHWQWRRRWQRNQAAKKIQQKWHAFLTHRHLVKCRQTRACIKVRCEWKDYFSNTKMVRIRRCVEWSGSLDGDWRIRSCGGRGARRRECNLTRWFGG